MKSRPHAQWNRTNRPHVWMIPLVALWMGCHPAHKDAEHAYRKYAQGAYDAAVVDYQRALIRLGRPSSNEGPLRYNLGAAYYQVNQTRMATAEFLQSVEKIESLSAKEKRAFLICATYNLGNAFYREQDFARAVDAYRETLKLAPDDADAKHNLELALERLQQTATGGGPRSDNPRPNPQPGDGDSQPLPQRPAGISPEDARRLLDMLGNDDIQKQQERLRNLMPPRYDVDKDW